MSAIPDFGSRSANVLAAGEHFLAAFRIMINDTVDAVPNDGDTEGATDWTLMTRTHGVAVLEAKVSNDGKTVTIRPM